ncbi:MAG TPA: hypothetical protein GXX14_08735 [Clostridiaceae bacterium]|nr:hypothetical protein [Clostridiaceae bacterium]
MKKICIKCTLTFTIILCILLTSFTSMVTYAEGTPTIATLDGEGISISVDSNMSMTVFLVKQDGTKIQLTQKPDMPNPWSTYSDANTASAVLSSQSGYVTIGPSRSDEVAIDDFVLTDIKKETDVDTYFGKGDRLTVTGHSESLNLTRIIIIETAYGHPGVVSVTSKYCYDGDGTLKIHKFVENNYKIVGAPLPEVIPGKVEASLWSWQGSAIRWGADDLIPVYDTMGSGIASDHDVDRARASDLTSRNNNLWSTNGGTPFMDFYGLNGGIGIGSAMPYHLYNLEIPVKGSGIPGQHDTAYTWIGWPGKELQAGVLTDVGTSIVVAHTGDFYNGCRAYANAMKEIGHCNIPSSSLPDWAYDPHWETWGYGEDFLPEIVLAMLPELKSLGVKSITLDAGWYKRDEINGEGMYIPDPEKYANVGGFKAFVDAIHDAGLKVLGWCAPSVGRLGGTPLTSPLMAQHPDYFISSSASEIVPVRAGGYYPISSRCYDLCLGNPVVLDDFTTDFVNLFIGEYDLDGFKMDSVWGTHQCMAEGHGHDGDPDASIKGWSVFFKNIYEKAKAIKPDVMIINCNCGTPMNFYDFNGTNWPIPGDCVGSRQMRYRIKLYKAFYGSDFAVLGDHLYLSTLRNYNEGTRPGPVDFISYFGTGAVLDTKYISLKYGELNEDTDLPKSKAMRYPGDPDYDTAVFKFGDFQRWFSLYNDLKLSNGEFIGDLYMYGFDYPEAYVIKKNNNMFYAFYATDNSVANFKANTSAPVVDPWGSNYVSANTYNGDVELRGLVPGQFYKITDYINNVDYGVIEATSSTITLPNVNFTTGLLLCAEPVSSNGSVVVSEARTVANSNIDIKVSLKNFANVGGIKVTLNYDASKLQVENVEQSPLVFGAVNTEEPGTIIFNAIKSDGIPVGETSFDVATITFKVADSVEDGFIPIIIAEVEACDDNVDPLPAINKVNGGIWIYSGEPGDVNSDGKVNFMDALIILKSINNKITLTDKQTLLADYDGNGIINIEDVIAILRFDVGL